MSHLIHIENSLGVRIPKTIISKAGFTEETIFVFKVINEGILLAPVSQARKGWAKAFKASSKGRKDSLFV